MVDSVLLLVDAVEGPMPQTRFVTQEGARARPEADRRRQQGRPSGRARRLGRSTRPSTCSTSSARPRSSSTSRSIYASGLNGWATLDEAARRHRPARRCSTPSSSTCRRTRATPDDPLQLQICSLDYSTYVGRIGIGRVNQGTLKPMQDVAVLLAARTATPIKARVNQVLKFEGLERKQATEAGPGDIVLDQRHRGHRHRRHDLTDLERPAAAADARRSTSRR